MTWTDPAKRALVLLGLAVVGVSSIGCGGEDEPGVPAVERKEETADKLPKLERGYSAYSSPQSGVTFGRPPGWKATAKGSIVTLTAPDQLVAATISVDRTNEALASDPADFATETAKLVAGYRKPLDPSRAKRFKHAYDGASVTATGVAKKSGVKQNVRVVVLEREGVAVVTVVLAENAKRDTGDEPEQALESIRTLRTVPPA